MRCSKDFPDIGKYARIGSNIRMWCFSDRRLIDDDRFIDMFEAFDRTMLTDSDRTPMEVFENLIRQYINDKR